MNPIVSTHSAGSSPGLPKPQGSTGYDDHDYTLLPGLRVSLLPKSVIVVTSGTLNGDIGATTIAWQGVVSSRPPVVGVSFRRDSFCRARLVETNEFVINVPGVEQLAEVETLGATSGPLHEKLGVSLEASKHRLVESKVVRAPRLSGYFLHLECRALGTIDVGRYEMHLGKVVAMHASAPLVTRQHRRGSLNFNKVAPIMCFGDEYWAGGRFLGITHENKRHHCD